MKKIILLFTTLLFFTMTACANGNNDKVVSSTSTGSGQTGSTTTTTTIKGESSMKISISIKSESGNYNLTATLQDNSSARAFYELLQKGAVTVKMHDYGSFEKVGSLPTSLPRKDTQITTSAGDIILYQGNQVTIYYDTNSWNFTRLGKIDGVTQAELKKILDKGDVTAELSIEK